MQCATFFNASKALNDVRKVPDRLHEHLTKQIRLSYKFVNAISLSGAPVCALPCVASDSVLFGLQVLRLEDAADFLEDVRKMVGQLGIGEPFTVLDAGVFQCCVHPLGSQECLIQPQYLREPAERWDQCVGHYVEVRGEEAALQR